MAFNLNKVKSNRDRVRNGVGWAQCDQMHGPDSDYPLKVKIAILFDQWDTAHSAGMRMHARGLNAKQRKHQTKEGIWATIEPAEFANRKCLLDLPIIQAVSWSGPTFDTRAELDAWLASANPDDPATDPLDGADPKQVGPLFKLDAAGRWSIPEDVDTPECWHATEEQIRGVLLEDYAFVRMIVGLRQLLIEGVVSGEETLQGN